jgi:hypothetical protein
LLDPCDQPSARPVATILAHVPGLVERLGVGGAVPRGSGRRNRTLGDLVVALDHGLHQLRVEVHTSVRWGASPRSLICIEISAKTSGVV